VELAVLTTVLLELVDKPQILLVGMLAQTPALVVAVPHKLIQLQELAVQV
jgi:hypothetical protein